MKKIKSKKNPTVRRSSKPSAVRNKEVDDAIYLTTEYVSSYPDYIDRSRDIILLYLVEMVESIKTRR